MSFDLDVLVAELVAAREELTPLEAVHEVLARALHRPLEVAETIGYEIRLGSMILYRSEALTVQRFISPPRYTTGPHDHRMWAVIGTFGGTEDNAFFHRSGSGLVPSGGQTLIAGDLLVLEEDAIHDVASGSSPVGAIHVYGGDLWATRRSQWSGEPLTEHPMDLAADAGRFTEAARQAGLLVAES